MIADCDDSSCVVRCAVGRMVGVEEEVGEEIF